MKRNTIIAGNWKMNTTMAEGQALIADLLTGMKDITSDTAVIIAPPSVWIATAAAMTADEARISVAAQNCHQEDKGAYTGEVSAAMIASAGAQYVIIGHSERRQYFAEDEKLLAQKVDAALKNKLKVIFCMGEPLEVREADTQNEYVAAQLQSIAHLTSAQMENVVLAYEPIWAIGTGRTATSDQAQEMHAFLRSQLEQQFGAETAAATRILYGGSMNAANAADLMSKPDVDGGLIGGASLKAADFLTIIQAG